MSNIVVDQQLMLDSFERGVKCVTGCGPWWPKMVQECMKTPKLINSEIFLFLTVGVKLCVILQRLEWEEDGFFVTETLSD